MIDVEISGRIGQRTKDGIEPRNTGPDTLDALAERTTGARQPAPISASAGYRLRSSTNQGCSRHVKAQRVSIPAGDRLQPETKERKGSVARILVQTGRLRASVTDAK